MKKNYLFALPVYFLLLLFSGCASTGYAPVKPMDVPGVYHRVEKSQTLWGISKLYNVDLEEIVRVNHIQDSSVIEKDQLLLIPYRQKKITPTPAYSSDDFIWPVKARVLSTFGQTYNNMLNKGLNLEPYGRDDIVAARKGKVIFLADNFGNFGKTIIIDHGDDFSSVYARNSQVLVKIGDIVEKGAVIAKAGSAGRDRNIYLHFQIRKGRTPRNPYFYLPR